MRFYYIPGWWLELLSLIFGLVAYTWTVAYIWICRLCVPGPYNGLVLMRFFITYGRGGLNFVAYIWIGRLYLDLSLMCPWPV